VAILRIARLWPSTQRTASMAAHAAAAADRSDALDAFGSETSPAPENRPKPAPAPPPKRLPSQLPPRVVMAAKWAGVVVLTAAVAIFGVIEYQRRIAGRSASGSLTVETTPAGLDVVIAGKTAGKTPVTIALAPGAYDVQLGPAGARRTIKVNITAGSSIVQHVEMPAPADVAAAATGALRIQTEPSKLPVSIDGVERGVSPLTVEGVQPGDHEVTVRSERGTLRRSVKVQPRETVSLIVSSAIAPVDTSAVAAGWLTISSPVALQLREGGKVIGTTETDRLMLPAGDHDIELANESLGYKAQRKVHVNAGKTTVTPIQLPNGTMSLNASPWAEVFVDGERVGETPIGNLSRPIGRHEVIFRHPELGERRETVVVTVQGTARLGVDLRKK
jgi:PEGA domain